MLSPYRVLDLTTNTSAAAGAILADLGADVIAVEPPTGSPLRQQGPFRYDQPDVEHSLPWWAYSRNKRSVAIDLASPAGRDQFLRLVATADVVLDSFPAGYLDSLGLGHSALSARRPEIITASITPFGETGPKANWQATDLTVWASSGAHFITGDDDRAPVQVSMPQAFLHAGAEAAVAVLVALAARARDGLGQHVDVSAQAAAMMATQSVILAPAWNDLPIGRVGGGLKFGPLFVRFVYPCKDGYVNITLLFGNVLGPFTRRLMEWMHEEGFIDEATLNKDWISYVQMLVSGQEPVSEFLRVMQAIESFTRSHTKEELFRGTFERHVLVVPVSTPADILRSEQLEARGYWQRLAHPVANELATFPGPFARFSESPIEYRRRPPRLDEHAADFEPELPRPARTGPGPVDRRPPLAGLKVCDFSWVYAAPAATRVLADWGATVVKVESSKYLDALRTGQPYKDGVVGPERSANFCNVNVGKLGITLDLGTPEGREVALKLATWADVVVENFSPKAMRSWGLDFETLRARNPGLIMLSTCLSGSSGPQADLAGFGTMGAALAGFHEFTGWPDRPPAGPFLAYTDYVSPKFVAASILAALDHRRRTGQGQHVDLSQGEAALHFLAPLLLDHTVNQRLRTRDGNNSEECAPHGVFPCAGEDRWIAIACATGEQWTGLSAAAGQDWAADERFASFARRYANRNALEALIAAWTSANEVGELEELLQAHGVPAHRVSAAVDVLADPQLQARGHFMQVDQPEVGTVLVETPRFRLSRHEFVRGQPAPTLGQHNEDVLREILGFTDDELAALAVAGALE